MSKFLMLVIFATVVYAVETAHFYAVNSVGAPDSFVQSALGYLEEAYSTYASMGISLASPCVGTKYLVNITGGYSNELGYTAWWYTYHPDTGYINRVCVRYIAISYPVAQGELRPTAFHEIAHVAQAAYVRYKDVGMSDNWVAESHARAMEIKYGGGQCYLDFFGQSLYSSNPYSAIGLSMYAYFPFFLWLFDSYSPSTILQYAFSGKDYLWINQRYVDYLKALAKGQSLCGQFMRPQYIEVDLKYGGRWQTTIQLDGLSARYYWVRVPRGASVLIELNGATSNLAVGQIFRVDNDTLLLAVVNPSMSASTAVLGITVAAEPVIKVVSATYYADSGTLEYEIKAVLRYSEIEIPIEGWVTVNGTRLYLTNGIAHGSVRVPGPGRYALNVMLSDATVLLTVNIATPAIKAPIRLYFTNSSRGILKLEIENPGDAVFVTRLEVSAPNTSFNYTRSLTLKPGRTALDVAFSVRGEPGNMTYSLLVAPNKWYTAAKTTVVPLKVYVKSAHFNGTHIRAVLNYGVGNWTAAFPGLSGKVEIPHGGYILASVNVSLPRPTLRAEVAPDTVAPGWWNGTLNVAMSVACPPYQAYYEVPIRVNGTFAGALRLTCPNAPAKSVPIQFNTTKQRLTYVVETAVGSTTASTSPQYPRLNVSFVALYITERPYAVFNVSVAGPHRYLVAGRAVRGNSTVALKVDVGECAREATLDLGFAAYRFELPTPSISVEAWSALYPRPIDIEVTIRLPPQVHVNRTIAVYANSTPIPLRISTSNRYERYDVKFEPKAPGVYIVSAALWCKSANATVYSTAVRAVRLAVDNDFALVGKPIRLEVSAEWWPAQAPPPPVNVTLSGCEHKQFAMAPGVLGLRYDRQCTLTVVASAANVTAMAKVEVGCLNIVPQLQPVGYVLRRPVLTDPSQLRVVVTNCDGSPISADTSIEWPKAYGSATVAIRAEYRGRANETQLHIAYAPDTYVKAMALAERLRPRAAWLLQSMAESAALSGNWSAVEHIVEIGERSRGWPITEHLALWALSNHLEENPRYWLKPSSEHWLRIAELLSNYPYVTYVAMALLALALTIVIRRRRYK